MKTDPRILRIKAKAAEVAAVAAQEATRKDNLDALTAYLAPGRDGSNGLDGPPGADGRDGLDGAPGADGIGIDGRHGEPAPHVVGVELIFEGGRIVGGEARLSDGGVRFTRVTYENDRPVRLTSE